MFRLDFYMRQFEGLSAVRTYDKLLKQIMLKKIFMIFYHNLTYRVLFEKFYILPCLGSHFIIIIILN